MSDCERYLTDVNPRYVLRNWMSESAIRKAEMNDFSEVCLLYLIYVKLFNLKPVV